MTTGLDMTANGSVTPLTLADAARLGDYLRQGAKPSALWRCGLELELFGYTADTWKRLNPSQVARVLQLLAKDGRALSCEEGHPSEVLWNTSGARITLEPGGQIEFSGAPYQKLADIAAEAQGFLARLHEVAESQGFIFIACGFDPVRRADEQHWYPKPRYRIMKPYLATRGRRAWDMMCRTCGAQVNLDYYTDADLVRKFSVAYRLAPIVAALCANSPLAEGRPSGYQSTRQAVWLDTDAARTNLSLPDTFTVEDYVAYALSVPMLFARRGTFYSDAPTGLAFRDFLAGACSSVLPVKSDWADHLTTIFTDARLKQYLEIRSADSASFAQTMALMALWKGLLYHAETLAQAWDLGPRLSIIQNQELRAAIARDGLRAEAAGVSVRELAKSVVMLAHQGLAQQAKDETHWLAPLEQAAAEGRTAADIILQNWHGQLENALRQWRVA